MLNGVSARTVRYFFFLTNILALRLASLTVKQKSTGDIEKEKRGERKKAKKRNRRTRKKQFTVCNRANKKKKKTEERTIFEFFYNCHSTTNITSIKYFGLSYDIYEKTKDIELSHISGTAVPRLQLN
jgi:hypothetical protein